MAQQSARRGRKNQAYSSCLEHAFMIWSPVCELPYGPAASSLHHQRPDRWQHPTSADLLQKSLASHGASTDEYTPFRLTLSLGGGHARGEAPAARSINAVPDWQTFLAVESKALDRWGFFTSRRGVSGILGACYNLSNPSRACHESRNIGVRVARDVRLRLR